MEPAIYRQRAVLEGHYTRFVDGETVRTFLTKLSFHLKMRIFAGPFAWPPDPWTCPAVELCELNGFVAWTESGAHLYAWRFRSFFSLDVYSCKPFSELGLKEFTAQFWNCKDIKLGKIVVS